MSSFARHLIILRGDNQSITTQLNYTTTTIAGDWIAVADEQKLPVSAATYYSTNQAKLLLGQEFQHAIFDARDGFDLEALAILTGTLVASSLCVLILPMSFTHWQDQDSLRWSELPAAINVPHFVKHLNEMILLQQRRAPHSIDCFELNTAQHEDYFTKQIPPHYLTYQKCDLPQNYFEQQQLLERVLKLEQRIIVITAKRGRGKSALAGSFATYHDCWITAPNRQSVTTLMRFAADKARFIAPDELIMQLNSSLIQPKWLIIDEAAMIPLPMLVQLIEGFKRILLTTTTDGYEGTGQGLLLKLLAKYQQHDQVAMLHLTTPIRWQNHDPLEHFIDNLTVALGQNNQANCYDYQLLVKKITQDELVASTDSLAAFFGLLKTAHYRTTLIDLRRLLDAKNLWLYRATLGGSSLAGVLIGICEGGLTANVIDQILKGYRRPKGNLVAQSLVAHAGEPTAAILRSIRVNRIAVVNALRQRGIARTLLAELIDDARQSDCAFVSVSFAYSADMLAFWINCGFVPVHVGSNKEASSGSYAVMAIYPLTPAGTELCHTLKQRLARNWYWLKRFIPIDLPIMIDDEQALTDRDWAELSLFATTHYAYSASFAVLSRLANWIKHFCLEHQSRLPLLMSLVLNQFDEKPVIASFQLSGKNQLLTLLRTEIYQFIAMQGSINE
ncbi:tRNA(Met)-cytidine N(4)-acetyltransferase [Orbus hercynius]|uniref:tRNA(Met) cytidine acetyltransferase TmcA n=1 Tax=Orbus hercynius TaxID=593135 RepID=A0A495RJT2_9GAMM|nr:tRNA-binding protein [Orbus hercynius]RKS87777.1 tRNA(Met)-cytidine N(4)-acetyltransferase [Orbus hercynius]